MRNQTRREKEFERLYREFQHDIYVVSLYYIREEVAAEEITQKVFYELYLHYQGANVENMYTYLCSAARNTAYNWAKTHKRLVYVTDDSFLEETIVTDATQEEEYFRKEQKNRASELAETIMERLYKRNPLWHEAVYLVYCLEKPHAQVAKELGISKDSLHSRLYRAGQWVRKHYRQEYEEVRSWSS